MPAPNTTEDMMFTPTRINTWIAAAVLAAGVAAAGYASAQNTPPGDPALRQGGRGPGGFAGRGGPIGRGGPFALPLPQLGLSEAQRETVRTITQSHEAELKAEADRAHAARQALHAAVASVTFDENLIRAKAAEVAQVEADVAVLQARLRSEIVQQVLTAQQREQRQKLESERQAGLENAPRGPRGRRGGI
jgi:Spy/CpxP family protein refolding chaperone